MGKCLRCHRHGLFFKVNVDGYCEECAQIKLRDEKERNKKQLMRAEFERLVSCLDSAPVLTNGSPVKKRTLSEIPEFTFTNVTASSNPDKLGNFVSIDVESTGLNKRQSDIIEVSAIRFDSFSPVSKYSTFIKPKHDIPDEITKLTGITNEMVSDAPTFSQILPSFSEFIASSNIVGHKLKFDLEFLYVNGYDPFTVKRKYFDTLSLAQKTIKGPKYKWIDGEYGPNYDGDWEIYDHKLGTLCDYFRIYISNAHRSAYDSFATGLVFHELVSLRVK